RRPGGVLARRPARRGCAAEVGLAKGYRRPKGEGAQELLGAKKLRHPFDHRGGQYRGLEDAEQLRDLGVGGPDPALEVQSVDRSGARAHAVLRAGLSRLIKAHATLKLHPFLAVAVVEARLRRADRKCERQSPYCTPEKHRASHLDLLLEG